jgi:hypothetical protein
MTKLQAVEQAVQELGPEELEEFRAWFEEFDAAQFDAKIKSDALNGRLDALAEAALREHRAGRSREI